MQVARRSMTYSLAGIQSNVTGRIINVRTSVHVPNMTFDIADDRKPYICTNPVDLVRKQPKTISIRAALIFLSIFILFFGVQICGKLNRKSYLENDITKMYAAIEQTKIDNIRLAEEVKAARDPSRICYRAVQSLGMTSSEAVEAVYVIAPNTRPYETNAQQPSDEHIIRASAN